MSDNLARVQWSMGQVLLPELLQAQDEAVIANTIIRCRTMGLPGYGLAEWVFDQGLLLEGEISVQAMTLILQSGLLLKVPQNAACTPLNLNATGKRTIEVFIHIEPEHSETAWNPESASIPRRRYHLALSTDEHFAQAMYTMKLAVFEKNAVDHWQVADTFAPPLINLGKVPFFQRPIEKLQECLERLQLHLIKDIDMSYLSGDHLTTTRQCLKSVYRSRRYLANLRSQIHLHPYALYEMLKELYMEVCFYKNVTPQDIFACYEHDALAKVFNNTLQPLAQLLSVEKLETPYLPFKQVQGVMEAIFPDSVRAAQKVYLLVQKSEINQTISIENRKMSSRKRLPLIHRLALHGLRLTALHQPDFQHPFGPEVAFFLVEPGEEWDHCLKDLSIAFYAHEDTKTLDFFLYWRMG